MILDLFNFSGNQVRVSFRTNAATVVELIFPVGVSQLPNIPPAITKLNVNGVDRVLIAINFPIATQLAVIIGKNGDDDKVVALQIAP